ncbi:MAG: hypothetical protein MJ192_10665 [Clostridia bacterium]|nr:hypothetical protein [Clostridia bacterium]
MKKLLTFLLLVCVTVSSAVICVSAGAAVDKEHGIGYYLWLDASDANNCKSGGEPLNQTTLDFAEIDGEAGVKMTYAPNGAGFDPYYSLVHLDLGKYRYCVMRYYFECPTDRSAGGNIFVRYDANGGGQIWKNVTYENNCWTTVFIDFTQGTKWPDENPQISWFRIGHKSQEGEALYVRFIAFFETMEEAEAFEGLADFGSYNDTVAMAKSLKADEYTNFDLVEKALAEDVSGCFFSDEQYLIDNAEKNILNAIGQLKRLPEPHGEYRAPSAEVLELLTEAPTEAPTAPPTEPDVTAPEEPDTQPAGGCGGLICMPAILGVCVCLALSAAKRREKK